jgi:sialate O-acetylesterase
MRQFLCRVSGIVTRCCHPGYFSRLELKMNRIFSLIVAGLIILMSVDPVPGTVTLPNLFTDHMVVQREIPILIWGKADPGEAVNVVMARKQVGTEAGPDGCWKVRLDPFNAGGPHEISIEGRDSRIVIRDVLVGEVWICSGQSNMEWSVNDTYDADLVRLTADYTDIRLITVPHVGTQDPRDDFEGAWQLCSGETVGSFSAVGYHFGRQLYQALKVPIGLINNAWGGSACEAWIPREVLESRQSFEPLLAHWDDRVKQAAENKEAKTKFADLLAGQYRPANLYNGVLHPTIGYGIRGAIWYQGENNVSRAHQYRDLFPLMIQAWRDKWGQGDFPFYWVQLADFQGYVPEPGPSEWAELREAQTMTMSRLNNTGEAVIIDLGEANDIHPRNKLDVAKRLSRWALARDYGYGYDIKYRSPQFRSIEITDGKAVLIFDHPGLRLDTYDVNDVMGFMVASDDRKFHHARAEITGRDTIEVTCEDVSVIAAVRYGWADNPVCNVFSHEGLPLTPFRTDQWKGLTEGRDY